MKKLVLFFLPLFLVSVSCTMFAQTGSKIHMCKLQIKNPTKNASIIYYLDQNKPLIIRPGTTNTITYACNSHPVFKITFNKHPGVHFKLKKNKLMESYKSNDVVTATFPSDFEKVYDNLCHCDPFNKHDNSEAWCDEDSCRCYDCPS